MRIRVEGLRKSFGSNVVLDGIDLEVPEGRIATIVGESGTGKSVLLKHLIGLLKPDAGKIYVDDTEITGLSEQELMPLRRRFGMIFQGGGLLNSLTVRENVGLPLQELTDESRGRIDEIVREKLEIVDLAGTEDQMPSTLSGGQMKRAAIARALTMEAECLLFDEPTTGLDPVMSDAIDDVIRRVNEGTGATVVVVTHDVESVFAISDYVFMLDDGKLVFRGEKEQFRESGRDEVQAFLSRGRSLKAGK